jgi:hypothetical protein
MAALIEPILIWCEGLLLVVAFIFYFSLLFCSFRAVLFHRLLFLSFVLWRIFGQVRGINSMPVSLEEQFGDIVSFDSSVSL